MTALLDGEVIVGDRAGHAGLRRPAAGSERGPQRPLLLLRVRPPLSRRHRPYARRAARPQGERCAAARRPDDGVLKLSEHFTEQRRHRARHACRLSLEGIVSKLATAPYHSGRTKAWLKSKCIDSDEFIVIGYVPSTTQRRTVGSLALGYFDKGKLVYAGRVGSGFSTAVADDLWRRLEDIRIAAPALDPLPPVEARRNVRWVKPQLVAEVEMRGWTADGILRHAVFKGLRQDKEAADVAPEKPIVKSKSTKASKADQERAGARRPAHPSRPRAVARRRRDEAGAGRVLHRDLAGIAPARGRSAARAGALPGRRRGGLLLPEACLGRHHRARHPRAAIRTDGEELLADRTSRGCISLVQASVLEIHVWGAKLADIERPDGITFDLDPAPRSPGRTWSPPPSRCATGSKTLGLASFVKTTGGKGLHVYRAAQAARRLGRRQGLRAQARRGNGQGQPATLPGHRLQGGAPGPHLRRLPAQRPRRHGRCRLLGARAGGRRRLHAARSGASSGPEMRPDRFTITNLLNRLAQIDDPWTNTAQERAPSAVLTAQLKLRPALHHPGPPVRTGEPQPCPSVDLAVAPSVSRQEVRGMARERTGQGGTLRGFAEHGAGEAARDRPQGRRQCSPREAQLRAGSHLGLRGRTERAGAR